MILYLEKKIKNVCCDNGKRAAQFAEKPGQWSFHGLGQEEKWYGSLVN